MTTNKPRCADCNRVLNNRNQTIDTAPRVSGLTMCDDCYDIAGLENEHQDGVHDADQEGPHADCPMCGNAIKDRSKPSNDVKAHAKMSHADCYANGTHEKTREGRAACRKARNS